MTTETWINGHLVTVWGDDVPPARRFYVAVRNSSHATVTRASSDSAPGWGTKLEAGKKKGAFVLLSNADTPFIRAQHQQRRDQARQGRRASDLLRGNHAK